MKFNLSRPHSSIDHRRTCAVVGCKNKESYHYSPLCVLHGTNPEVIKAMMMFAKENS